MAIEVALEAQLEEEKDFEGYLHLVAELAQKWQLKMEIMDTYALIDVCPEGTIQMSFTDGFLSITAQTAMAGPGFHAYVCDFFHAIEEKSPLTLTVIDPAHYYSHHNFDRLVKEVFHKWLSEIAQYLHNISDQDDCDQVSLLWPDGYYQPLAKKGYVVTLMGYISMEDFWKQDMEELAERFFVWNHLGRDGAYYRNAALNLLWKECYFEYSNMNEMTEKYADTILDYLEIAHRLDPLMALPMKEYQRLCEIRLREKRIHEANEMHFDLPIGYRRDIVNVGFGCWNIPISGFTQVNFNESTQALYLTAPYRSVEDPWQWMAKINVIEQESMIEERLREWDEVKDVIDLSHDQVKGKACLQNNGDGYFQVRAYCIYENQMLLQEWTINGETTAKALIKQLKQIHAYQPAKENYQA